MFKCVSVTVLVVGSNFTLRKILKFKFLRSTSHLHGNAVSLTYNIHYECLFINYVKEVFRA